MIRVVISALFLLPTYSHASAKIPQVCVTNLKEASQIEGNYWTVWDPEVSPVRVTLLFDQGLTPTQDLIIGQAALSYSETLPLHRHQETETYRIISGQGQMQLGEQEILVGPGDYIYIPPNVPHQISGASRDEDLIFEFTFAASKLSENDYIFMGYQAVRD